MEDPNSLEDDMGVIVLNLRLVMKSGDIKRNVSKTIIAILVFLVGRKRRTQSQHLWLCVVVPGKFILQWYLGPHC